MSSKSPPNDDFKEFEGSMAQPFLCRRRREVSGATVTSDITALRQYIDHLGKTSVEEATYQDVAQFVDTLVARDCTEGTARGYVSTISELHKFLNFFHGEQMPNVSSLVSRYDTLREGIDRVALSPEEVKQLINATESLRDALVVAIIYYQGLRASGAADLMCRHIRDDDGKVDIRDSKGGDDRTLSLHPKLGFLLDTWLNKERPSYPHAPNSEYLFVGDASEKIDNQDVWSIVHEAAEKAGIQAKVGERADGRPIYRVKPHVLRHSFATHAFDEGHGMPIEDIAIFLGHDDTRTTKQYIHDKTEDQANHSYDEHFDGL